MRRVSYGVIRTNALFFSQPQGQNTVLVPEQTQFCFYPTLYKPRNQEPTRRSQGLFACAVYDGLV